MCTYVTLLSFPIYTACTFAVYIIIIQIYVDASSHSLVYSDAQGIHAVIKRNKFTTQLTRTLREICLGLCCACRPRQTVKRIVGGRASPFRISWFPHLYRWDGRAPPTTLQTRIILYFFLRVRGWQKLRTMENGEFSLIFFCLTVAYSELFNKLGVSAFLLLFGEGAKEPLNRKIQPPFFFSNFLKSEIKLQH